MSYEITAITDGKEVLEKAKELGFEIEGIEGGQSEDDIDERNGSFFSADITYNDKKLDMSTIREMWDYGWDEDELPCPEDDEASEEIPGLKCPDCAAQAYKTNHPKVAVCGAFPGWYFFYNDIKKEGDSGNSNKIVMKYVNGVLQPVMVQESGIEVGENKN